MLRGLAGSGGGWSSLLCACDALLWYNVHTCCETRHTLLGRERYAGGTRLCSRHPGYGSPLPLCGQGNRARFSGHDLTHPDGTLAGPFGRVGAEVTVEQGHEATRLMTLAILSALKREPGSLGRVVPNGISSSQQG